MESNGSTTESPPGGLGGRLAPQRPKIGRPLKNIDPEQVRKLALLGCSLSEIGRIVGCDAKTITNRFSDMVELGDARGKMMIRRRQFKLAMQGSERMLIHLGMSRLDQRLKADVTSGDRPFGYFERAQNPRDPDVPAEVDIPDSAQEKLP